MWLPHAWLPAFICKWLHNFWQCCGDWALNGRYVCYVRELIKCSWLEESLHTVVCLSCVSTTWVTAKKQLSPTYFRQMLRAERATRIHSNKTLLSKFPWRKWTHKIFAADSFVQLFEVFNINLAYRSLAPHFFIEVSGPAKGLLWVCLENKILEADLLT